MLVPACSRRSRRGWWSRPTPSACAHSRKLVLELLGSSVDLSTRRAAPDTSSATTPTPERFGPPAPPAASGTARAPGTTRARTGARPRPCTSRPRSTTSSTSATTRTASSATSASTPAASSTRTRSRSPSPAAGSTRASRPSSTSPLPDSACVYCGNCIAVCPTGALMFVSEYELREAGKWDEDEPDRHRDDLPVLRRRLHARAARPGQPDRQGHAPADHDVTRGNLCIKGRFGFQHVQD